MNLFPQYSSCPPVKISTTVFPCCDEHCRFRLIVGGQREGMDKNPYRVCVVLRNDICHRVELPQQSHDKHESDTDGVISSSAECTRLGGDRSRSAPSLFPINGRGIVGTSRGLGGECRRPRQLVRGHVERRRSRGEVGAAWRNR
ncbi:unnamed protein product [Ectocarpus sp. 12 AP-2014]